MDINQVLMDYDNMFGTHSLEDIEEFLTTHIEMAEDEKDYNSALSLMNEMVGLCRDSGQNMKGLRYCMDIEDMLVKLGIEGTVPYANRLVNVANAYRAFGYGMKAQSLYERVEVIYREKLPAGDFAFSELYSNWAMLFEKNGEWRKAEVMYRRALAVVDLNENAWMEQAVTRCNLAETLLQIAGGVATGADGQKMDALAAETIYDEACDCLAKALRIFEWDGKRDYHYGLALSTMGDALSMKEDYVQAAGYYEQAMQEIEKHVGKNDTYLRMEERYNQANRMAEELKKHDSAFDAEPVSRETKGTGVQYLKNVRAYDSVEYDTLRSQEADGEGMTEVLTNPGYVRPDTPPQAKAETEKPAFSDYVDTLPEDVYQKESEHNWLHVCKRFYEVHGAKMIHEEFGDYEARIAVGLVGEGSECFGYDDEISRDHDFALGFCMWLSEEDYRSIGAMLQRAYEQLLVDFGDEFLREQGVETPVNSVNKVLSHRRGVSSVREFYENLLGVKVQKTEAGGYILPDSWRQISEEKLAAATNGMVFRDDAGAFSKIRDSLLEYYPTKVWMMRLAEKLHGFAQTAQTNYARMMARKDYVTAALCVAKGMQYTMEIIYLLNQRYAPYYKWMRKGMQGLSQVDSVAPILDRIAVIPTQAAAWEGRTYSAGEVNYKDEIAASFEDIAEYLLMELKMQGVVKGTDTFLDVYAQDLVQRVDRGDFGAVEDAEMEASYREYVNDLKQAATEKKIEKTKDDMEEERGLAREWCKEPAFDREEAIAEIVEVEWKRFGCNMYADDWNTFFIMRKSRYLAFDDALLEQVKRDLAVGEATTFVRSEKRLTVEDDLVKLQMDWLQEFMERYPKMGCYAGFLYTNNPETSIRGVMHSELNAYPDETFILYGKFVTDLAQKGENLIYNCMTHMAHLYGYASVEDAEQKL